MKKLKIWFFRIFTFGLLSGIMVIGTVLNPGILYAHQTEFGQFTVYHNSALNDDFEDRLRNVREIIRNSELYDPDFQIRICLNDGSSYPALIEKLRGPAFGWGFHNLAVFRGDADYTRNKVELNGYQWNMEQLFVHEIIHCMQTHALGFFNSNPVASHPEWKWEGYAEYVSRQNADQLSLIRNIERLEEAKVKNANGWAIEFEDGTVVPRVYAEHWILVQYCLDVKGMTYRELLDADSPMGAVREEMMQWKENQTDL